MNKPLPTPEMLHKLLRYEPDTGLLFWRERTPDLFPDGGNGGRNASCNSWNTLFAGKEALTADCGRGWRKGIILGRSIRSHRAIWAMQTGAWPTGQIDHEDHDRSNNRFKNLRDVTSAVNMKNQTMYANNTSGVTGVHWFKEGNIWRASISVNGKLKHLGGFHIKDDAIAARKAAEIENNFHENHGRKMK